MLPFWQILFLLPVGQMCSAQKQLLCMAPVSCSGRKLLFDGMPGGLGVLFPKGWVPPRPAVPVPQTVRKSFLPRGQVEEGRMVL